MLYGDVKVVDLYPSLESADLPFYITAEGSLATQHKLPFHQSFQSWCESDAVRPLVKAEVQEYLPLGSG
jgi:hypothetical protein